MVHETKDTTIYDVSLKKTYKENDKKESIPRTSIINTVHTNTREHIIVRVADCKSNNYSYTLCSGSLFLKFVYKTVVQH